MRRRVLGYRVTLLAVAVLLVSFAILHLGSSGLLPTTGIWRGLVIPAYLTMLVSAVLRTTLPAAGGILDAVFILAGIALSLLPFLAIDWLVGRHRRPH